MRYIDSFVLVVPKATEEEYIQLETQSSKIWKKYGALDYFACKGSDLTPDMGEMKTLRYPDLVNLKEDETLWIAFIFYKSKEHRDEVTAKVMQDPEMDGSQWEGKTMPFDMERMVMGGFEVVIDLPE